MTEDTQAVVDEAKTSAKPDVKADNAQDKGGDDLDTLLDQFKQEQPEPEAKPKTEPEQKLDTGAVKRLETLEKTLAEERFQRSIQPVLKRVRGDIPAEVLGDDEILDLLDGRAKRDPRLQQAWLNRDKNPAAWSKIEQNLGRELSKKFSKLPDQGATDDREAVAAAVRGASTKAPEGKPPDFSKMSDNQFQAEKEKMFG